MNDEPAAAAPMVESYRSICPDYLARAARCE